MHVAWRPVALPRVFAHDARDAWPFAVALAHAASIAAVAIIQPAGAFALAAIAAVAFATVYVSNTVAHIHLHTPLFASRAASQAFSLLLTVSLGLPQTAWKQRHMWHHAGEPRRSSWIFTRRLCLELGIVVAEVGALAMFRPRALAVLGPGVVLGLGLAWVQGRLEHAGDDDIARSGVSHYGALYNWLWFNDGHHAEHHRAPSRHWTTLPAIRCAPRRTSTWAPILRWCEGISVAALLCALERVALASPVIQRWLVRRHAAALGALLGTNVPARVLVVGGGLFPRTALVVDALLPDASITIVDACAENLAVAKTFLAEAAHNPRRGNTALAVDALHATYDPNLHRGFDLVVFPLAFVGDRALVHAAREANGLVVAHDWIFGRRVPGARSSRVVSWFLLKRLVMA